ncbi:MAG: hypothetical protein NTU44_09245, partial [Bacteroidetes bacterium]|nr:hypothetical protein [Bacteroidota bacterium]
MKKLLLFGLVLSISICGFSQQRAKHVSKNAKVNIQLQKPVNKGVDMPSFLSQKSNPYVKSTTTLSDTIVGTTRYDLQSNGSTQNRIYLHPDGTIGVTWTYGIAETAFNDRGTGYNYNDGHVWGPEPTARIEDVRVGWPSYFPVGTNGEMVITHIGTNAGLKISKRT